MCLVDLLGDCLEEPLNPFLDLCFHSLDLIPIPIGDVCVIVGMDWLSRFGAMIYCEG